MKTILPCTVLLVIISAAASGLSLDRVLGEVHAMPDVGLSALRYEAAELAVERSTRPELPSLSVSPAARATGGPGVPDISRAGIAGSVALTIPLGRTADQISRTETLTVTAAERQRELDAVRRDTVLEVTRLYHTTWLQQELTAVRIAERDVAVMQYSADRLRFERGEIALATLLRSEQSLADAEAAVRQIVAERALQLARLSILTGVPIDADSMQVAPPALLSNDTEAQIDLRSIDLNLVRRATEYESLTDIDTPDGSLVELSRIATSISHTQAYGELGASVSLSPNSRNASVSYQSPEVLFIGDAPQTQERWSASLTVSISIDPNLNRDLAEAEARASRDEASIQLQAAENRIAEAEQRAVHDIAVAREALDAAVEQLERSRRTRDLVAVQLATGRATAIDEHTADAAILRSEYLVQRARFEYEHARMRAHPERAAHALDEWRIETMENES